MKFITQTIYYTMKKALPLFISLCLVISSIPAESLADSLLAPPGKSESANLSFETIIDDPALDITHQTELTDTTVHADKPKKSPRFKFPSPILNIAAIIVLAFALFLTPAPETMADEVKDNPAAAQIETNQIADFLSHYNISTFDDLFDKNDEEKSEDWMKEIGVQSDKTKEDIMLLVSLNRFYQDVAEENDFFGHVLGDIYEALLAIDDAYDHNKKQIEIIESHEPLEFDEGLIYHCGPDFEEALIRNRTNGECYFTRFPHEWAIGHFADGSKNPAIFVMNTDVFNSLVREKKANLYIGRPERRKHVEPYPKAFDGFSLDDIEEIWVTKEDFLRYRAIARTEDISELNENDKKLYRARDFIKQLMEEKKLKPVQNLRKLTEMSEDKFEKARQQFIMFNNNMPAVGMHMMRGGHLRKVPFLKPKGRPSPFKNVNKAELIRNCFFENTKRLDSAISKFKLYNFLFIASLTATLITAVLLIYRHGSPKRRRLIKALIAYNPVLANTLSRKQITKLLKLPDPSKAKVKIIIKKEKGTSNQDLIKIAEIIRNIQSGT